MTARIFCSVEDRKKGEPMAGLGRHPLRNLLIQWPIGRWSDNLRRARDMTPEELARVEATVESGWRINLMDRPGEEEGIHRIYRFPEEQAYRVPRAEIADFLAAFVAGGDLARWRDGPTPDRVMLCCTHGKKDKCCARFGNIAWRALVKAQQTHNLPVDIWRCTHLGGCRFAASAIMFPERRKYGRIEPEQALPLLQTELANRPLVPVFRGSPDLTPPQQCAEVNALEWLQARGYNADLSVHPATGDEQQTRVSILWQDAQRNETGRLEVDCHTETLWRYATCKDIPTGEVEGIYWALDDIRAL